jgi:hypothetical protein
LLGQANAGTEPAAEDGVDDGLIDA